MDETHVEVQGQLCYLYRALVDVRLSDMRDFAAAQVFFRSAWAVIGVTPDRITTDGHDASRVPFGGFGEWLSTMPQPFWLFEAARERGGSISLEPSPHHLCIERRTAMNRVTQRVLFVIVITLLSCPFAIRMSEAQQSITQQSMILQSTTQSSQMQVLVIEESVFTSSAQRAIAVTEEGIFIVDAQYIYSVTANGTTVELRAGSCA